MADAGDPEPYDTRPTGRGRLVAGLLAFAVGALFGVLGTVGHQSTVVVGQVTLPYGLVLALTGATALLVGLRMVMRDRFIVLLAAVGMLGVIFLLSLRSAGGSVLIPQGMPGLLWTIVPALVAAVVVAWPRLPARQARHRLEAPAGEGN